MAPVYFNKISLLAFNKTLSRYPSTAPSALTDLDKSRYETIPVKVTKAKTEAHLLKADVEKLVEWKLKHGTYRPALMSLVKSNPADLVKSTTQEAFASMKDNGDVMQALKILTKLRGIGPATASLLLSVFRPEQVPFFSDELFRWTHWDANGKTGWSRSIKYNVTEYKEVLARVEQLRKRLDVAAVDIEKVAYVLGKENVDLDNSVDTEEGDEAIVNEQTEENKKHDRDSTRTTVEAKEVTGRTKKEIKKKGDEKPQAEAKATGNSGKVKKERVKQNAAQDITQKGTKRKAQEGEAPAERTRRSTRRKE